jgi:hypothetical protein
MPAAMRGAVQFRQQVMQGLQGRVSRENRALPQRTQHGGRFARRMRSECWSVSCNAASRVNPTTLKRRYRMATYVEPYPHERRIGERRREFAARLGVADGLRVSWGGIWGGVLVAIGLLLLLSVLGVAIGVTAVDPGDTQAESVGTGIGVWGGISLLISLFVGGMVSTRIGAIFDRTTGFFEGALVWAVTVLLMIYLATTGVGMLASGAFSMVRGVGSAVGMMAQDGDVSSGDVNQILSRLREPKTAQQIAAATGIPQNEVQSSLNATAQAVEQVRNDPAQAAQEARRGVADLYAKARASGALERKAEQVQPAITKGAWASFGALLISLAAAVIGAMAGRRRYLPRTQAEAV